MKKYYKKTLSLILLIVSANAVFASQNTMIESNQPALLQSIGLKTQEGLNAFNRLTYKTLLEENKDVLLNDNQQSKTQQTFDIGNEK